MNDHLAVVKQDPTSGTGTLSTFRADRLFGEFFQHFPRGRSQLSLILSRADDEEVGDRGNGVNVENQRVTRRRIADHVRNAKGEGAAFAHGSRIAFVEEWLGLGEVDGFDGNAPSRLGRTYGRWPGQSIGGGNSHHKKTSE